MRRRSRCPRTRSGDRERAGLLGTHSRTHLSRTLRTLQRTRIDASQEHDARVAAAPTRRLRARVARGGREALEVFPAFGPRVVLLDIGMPDMNGYEVARTIRSRWPDQPAVLVALTGWGQEDDRRRAREAGFNHHLVKPADIDKLQELLRSVEAQG